MKLDKRNKISLIILFVFILIGLSLSSQFFAAAVGYSYELGIPKFYIYHYPIYSPISILLWIKYYKYIVPDVCNQSLIYLFICSLLGIFIVFMINKKQKKLTNHGSAEWATVEDIEKSNLYLSKDEVIKEFDLSNEKIIYQNIEEETERYTNGVVLGKDDNGKELKHFGVEHMLVMAPTRSGKGVGIVLPTLWTWKGSVFVNDIKEENWQLTSNYRKSIGQKILKFKPTSMTDSCSYNPLAEINICTYSEYQDAVVISDLLVGGNSKGNDDHFSSNGKNFLIGCILYVMYKKLDSENGANLRDVFNFITRPDESIQDKIKLLTDSDHLSESVDKKYNYDRKKYNSYLQSIYNEKIFIDGEERPFVHPTIRLVGGKAKNTPEKELGSIISTAVTKLQIFLDPALCKNTSKSDFKIMDLMQAENPISLYFVVQPKDLFITQTILKLITTQLVNILAKDANFNGKRAYKHRLLLLLDEFPAIGKLDFFETSLAFIAGYGLKVLMITQEIKQLYDLYGENNKIVGNCHVQIYFSPNDEKTPELISKKLGDKTIIEKNLSYKGFKYLSDWNWSEHEIGRPLMTSSEVTQLSKDKMIIFVSGHKPILANKIRWYKDKVYINRHDRK